MLSEGLSWLMVGQHDIVQQQVDCNHLNSIVAPQLMISLLRFVRSSHPLPFHCFCVCVMMVAHKPWQGWQLPCSCRDLQPDSTTSTIFNLTSGIMCFFEVNMHACFVCLFVALPTPVPTHLSELLMFSVVAIHGCSAALNCKVGAILQCTQLVCMAGQPGVGIN
jgi:hypothetical protein